jgi:hypothetical protein
VIDSTLAEGLVRSSQLNVCCSSSCNADIEQGEGTMLAHNATMNNTIYRKVVCNGNNYGVANKTYGLQLSPCKDCPINTYTAATEGTCANSTLYRSSGGGFFDPLACCTKPGWGFDGVQAAVCAQGAVADMIMLCTVSSHSFAANIAGWQTDLIHTAVMRICTKTTDILLEAASGSIS